MKQIEQLLISIIITFSICSYILAQGGTTFETAVQATFDTNNIADASTTNQYYHFTPDFNGFVAIGNCGLTELETEIMVYNSLGWWISANYYSCGFQTQLVVPVDSSIRYYIHWILYENTVQPTYNWYLTVYNPELGEFPQLAIPVEINDTIELSSNNNSTETWYKFEADMNKMITISTCGFGNEKLDINSIGVHKDNVETYTPDWMIGDNNCTDGKFLEFPTDSGSLYYINLNHKNDVTSAKWTINERDFTAGDICDSSIQVDKGIKYVVPSEKNGYWYKYTPVENEYKVIGSIQGEEQYADLFIKEDCDCEPDYFTPSDCMAGAQFGIALSLEAGKTYYIGWQKFDNTEINWSIYDPTDIVYFTVDGQIEPTVINIDNHTIEIKVHPNTSVTNLTPYFINPEGVDYIVNGENQHFNSQQDFTNPLIYTVRYINQENNETISQDWIVTVTKKEAPSGPYTVKSDYLKNPDLAKSLVSNFADFWKSAYDTEHGGFFSYIDREGNPTGDTKTIIAQTQAAYAFARAFMVTGDTSYLKYSDWALQFMYDHYWDKTNGGWYFIVDANGNVTDDYANTYKETYAQHYAN
ncbi:AGE family epimerase/isomerase, partial [Bacteroidota bacterium]